MRVALIHYHLLRGGVSSVLRRQARSLMEAGDEVLVIAGEAVAEDEAVPREYGGAPLAIVPELRYDGRRGQWIPGDEPERRRLSERLAGAVEDAMLRRWGSIADIIHVHNPLIRKNSVLIGALRVLSSHGGRLFLQNHDFAEDFRPDVYLADEGYPEDCHYAAINGRDHSFLRRAGLDPAGTHLLPNAVAPIESMDGLPRTRYLYPVRAIRRKNIGEALLLSMFIPEGCTVAITLPPASARDEDTYRHWKETAQRLSMPVEFELGNSHSLNELMGTAVCAVTTSVKEGFGFSFLEPWTAGRSAIGRRIDYVCSDFEREGVVFDNTYDSIDIPLVYLPAPLLRRKLEHALLEAYQAFRLQAPPYALKMLTDDVFSRDVFDFGRLDEELQTEVLETLASNGAAKEDVAEANPFLAGLPTWRPDEDLVATNRERILGAYAADAALARLKDAYRSVLERPVRHRLSKSVLLELFLDPLKLSLVGVGHA